MLAQCIKENWVSSAGPQVEEFERAVALLTGRENAVAVVNGTAAIQLSLIAAGVGPGDHVIVPDWTFAASANAVAHAGAVSHFVDVSEDDWALDAELTQKALESDQGIKAVIAVDPLGHAAHMDPLRSLCEHYSIPLIEDAAGAIGGSYHGRPCGSLGDLSMFSFNGNKTVTTGGGGMVLTDDDDMAGLIRHVATQARPGIDYIHDRIGYNYRMTNIAAAIGLAQLERLDEMVEFKCAIASRYDEAFSGRNDICPMPRPTHSDSACWLYSVRLPSEADAKSLVNAMEDGGVEARIFWRSLSSQTPWCDAPRTLNGMSASLSGTVVSLPSSSSLGKDEQARVIEGLNKWSGSGLRTQ